LIKTDFLNQFPYQLICAFINSKLWNFYYSKKFSNGSNLTVNISKTFLEMLPLPKNPNEEVVKKICSLVENQLILNEEIKFINLETKKELIKQKIQYNDDKINEYVYQLFDLEPEEIELLVNH